MNRLLLAGIACALLMTGCGKEEAPPPTVTAPPKPAEPTAVQKATVKVAETAEAAKEAAVETTEKAVEATKEAAAATTEAVKEGAAATTEAVKEGTAAATEAVKEQVAPATEAAAPAADGSEAQATSLLAQLKQQIEGNKLEDAGKTLTQLDALKAKLPQSLVDQIEALRKAYDAKKAAGTLGGVKLPG